VKRKNIVKRMGVVKQPPPHKKIRITVLKKEGWKYEKGKANEKLVK
jgi:hypothetical protein